MIIKNRINIHFENYEKENREFLRDILVNLAQVIKLESEYEHKLYIKNIEKKFAEYNNSKNVVGVNSGTTALQLVLKALGVKKGDEVILSAYGYISCAFAITNIGAVPVFVDVKEDTFTMDTEKIEEKITPRTKVIIPTHIHGNPCSMDEIVRISKKHNLHIIEDCCHAHGSEYKGIKVGNFGIGCFSNHNTKILSGMGKSGFITLDNYDLYKKIIGMLDVIKNPVLGNFERTPCRIGVLEASVLKTKLSFLDKVIEQRSTNAEIYKKNLPENLKYQLEEKKSNRVYREFVIILKKRDSLKKYLEKNGIQTKIIYDIPIHLTDYYKYLGYKIGNFPIAEYLCKNSLALPVSYYLQKDEIEFICNKIKGWFRSR